MYRFLLSFTLLLSLCGMASALDAPSVVPYVWHSVRIGGGGFVPGLVFQSKTRGLYYARTDVGGAYRWNDAKQRWVALTDWIDPRHNNWMGIESIAVDPQHPDRVYLIAGTYTMPWAGNGALLASDDRGRHFRTTPLPFPIGGNELGRGNGERLAVDPHDGKVLFLGTPANGLWSSNDRGRRWHRVATFPGVATSHAATAKNAWRRQPIGIVFVAFDPASGRDGAPTPVLYAGVSTQKTSLYRSDDGGRTWHAVKGQPTGLRPNHMVRGDRGAWYLTYGDQPGPDSMNDGAVYRFQPATHSWTDITPIPRTPGVPSGFGWGDIAVDAHDPNVLMATTFCHYTPHDEIFRSTDGGRHWTRVLPRSVFDHSSAPWTRDIHPHWMSDIAIDPADPDHVLFTTGYGIWASSDMRALDHGGTVHWHFQDSGLEETVALDLISPPKGAHLLSAMGDLDGFRHASLSVAPKRFAGPPRYANSRSIAFAGRAPLTIVRAGRVRSRTYPVRAAYSLDGGRHWQPLASEPATGRGSGSIAVGARGHTVVWAPNGTGHAYVTRDWGRHWQRCEGVAGEHLQVVADRVDARRFYILDRTHGRIAASDDGGAHFHAIGGALGALAAGLKPGREHAAHLYAVPGQPGQLYLARRDRGLLRARADGRVLARFPQVTRADSLGLGKAAPGHVRPTLYLAGTVRGRYALYRSIDDGQRWVRINDRTHQYGQIDLVRGDPRIFGRVYFGTGGRGIIYGDPAAGTSHRGASNAASVDAPPPARRRHSAPGLRQMVRPDA